ncbi:hypothetical protein CC2G_002807 [Coprinopsis cinerea AmutBmut pab1-1]|nr:hypothetical protein CC2G_002807 [Coprinopsis cinerea AmutBmut pab1-1]
MVSSALVVLSLLGSAFAKANDWRKPCHDGVCYYDLPRTANGPSGTLKIWGKPDAIVDITSAAGWEVLNCDKNAFEQDIRIVCTDRSKCRHLYRKRPIGRIVRLPENCGPAAFAHISSERVSEDQSIPESIARRVKRDGADPEVKTIHVDTHFDALDTEEVGEVYFALTGVNVPVDEELPITPVASLERRSDMLEARGWLDNIVKAIKKLNTVDVEKSKSLDIVNIDKHWNLLNRQLSCPPIQAGISIDADAKAKAAATLGVAAEGTIIPPKVTDFAVIASLTGYVDAGLDIAAGVTGNVDIGKIKLFEVGIPGLSFPGILTIGPTFRVDATATAFLDVAADINVGLSYTLEQATLVFPISWKGMFTDWVAAYSCTTLHRRRSTRQRSRRSTHHPQPQHRCGRPRWSSQRQSLPRPRRRRRSQPPIPSSRRRRRDHRPRR